MVLCNKNKNKNKKQLPKLLCKNFIYIIILSKMNTQKTTFMNRKAIEKEAMVRFGTCQYVDTITPSPKAD